MNVSEEKFYIYQMLRDITKERRQLVDMYYDLKKRLDFLNSLEERGIEDLSLTGYVDLYNQTQKETAVTNIQREADYIVNKIKNEIEENEAANESIIPKEEIQRAIEKENKNKRISREKLNSTITTILKDAGAPIKLTELLKRINFVLNTNLKGAYLSNKVLPELIEKSKINKPMRGYYQIKL